MATITFDTLRFVKKLEAVGVVPEQAEAFADAFRDAAGEAEIATKRDIERLEAKIDRLDTRLGGELTLIKWMLGLLLGGVIALVLKGINRLPSDFSPRQPQTRFGVGLHFQALRCLKMAGHSCPTREPLIFRGSLKSFFSA